MYISVLFYIVYCAYTKEKMTVLYFFLFQTEALDKIISLGGCPNKMVLGIGTYGKSYTLADSSQTDIGSTTTGDGNAGMYTQQAVSVLIFL